MVHSSTPLTTPDLVAGRLPDFGAAFSLTLQNRHPRRWLRNATVACAPRSDCAGLWSVQQHYHSQPQQPQQSQQSHRSPPPWSPLQSLDVAPGQTVPLVFVARQTPRAVEDVSATARIGDTERDACAAMRLTVRARLGEDDLQLQPRGGEGGAEVDDDNDNYDDDDEVVVSNVEVALRCRHTKQSFLFGFVDHDGAHAVAAAIAPRIGCSTGGEELGGAAP